MAAITFPSSPSNGDIFTVGTQSWRWNSSVPAWEIAPQSADLIASNVANTPAGNIAATTVQAAINELEAEKFPYAGGTVIGAMTVNGQLSASATQNIVSGEAVMTRSLSDGRYARRFETKTSAFTASTLSSYSTSGTFTVTDPTSAALNDIYEIYVLSGTITVSQVSYLAQSHVIRRCTNATGPVWETITSNTAVKSGLFNIDLTSANYFKHTLAYNTTISFLRVRPGKEITLEITGAGGYGLSWPGGITWINGTATIPGVHTILGVGVTKRFRLVATSETTFNGYLDLGTASASAITDFVTPVTANDIEITDKTKGVIFKGSDNTRWRMTLEVTGGVPSPVFTAL